MSFYVYCPPKIVVLVNQDCTALSITELQACNFRAQNGRNDWAQCFKTTAKGLIFASINGNTTRYPHNVLGK